MNHADNKYYQTAFCLGIPAGNAAVARVLVVGGTLTKLEGRSGHIVSDDPWMGTVTDWGVSEDDGWVHAAVRAHYSMLADAVLFFWGTNIYLCTHRHTHTHTETHTTTTTITPVPPRTHTYACTKEYYKSIGSVYYVIC